MLRYYALNSPVQSCRMLCAMSTGRQLSVPVDGYGISGWNAERWMVQDECTTSDVNNLNFSQEIFCIGAESCSLASLQNVRLH